MQSACSNIPTRSRFASRRSLKGTKGFTLFEVGIAGAVLVMGLVSAIVSMQRGFQMIDTARNSTLAAQIMQSEVERLRLLSWTDLNTTTIVPSSGTIDLSQVYSANSGIASKFTATRTVTPNPGREGTMVDIVISVNWTSYGVTHTRSFKTRYSKDGLYDYYYTKHS